MRQYSYQKVFRDQWFGILLSGINFIVFDHNVIAKACCIALFVISFIGCFHTLEFGILDMGALVSWSMPLEMENIESRIRAKALVRAMYVQEIHLNFHHEISFQVPKDLHTWLTGSDDTSLLAVLYLAKCVYQDHLRVFIKYGADSWLDNIVEQYPWLFKTLAYGWGYLELCSMPEESKLLQHARWAMKRDLLWSIVQSRYYTIIESLYRPSRGMVLRNYIAIQRITSKISI